MPDFYKCGTYNLFWHDGEYYIHNKESEEFQYFDETDDCLNAALKIAPFYKWERVDFE
jgi:hypothetical protein